MSIALKNSTGDFIYFDVITRYGQKLPSQLTKHPVDGKGVISDHIVQDNPQFHLVGFISEADFNSSKPDLTSEDRAWLGVNSVVVDSDIASIVSVDSDNNPNNLFPDVIGQFFTDSIPEISGVNEVKQASYSNIILVDVLKEFYRKRETVSLFEFDRGNIVQELFDMVITNIAVDETAENGDGIAFDITLEQANISNLVEEELPEDVRTDFQAKASAEAKKGSKQGNSVDAPYTATESDSGSFAITIRRQTQ